MSFSEWTEKYRPKTLKNVVGNQIALQDLKNWGVNWRIQKKKALILYGCPGVGKTSAAHALANDMGWDVTELNASDQRTAGVINRVVGSASQSYGFSGVNLIILDEADNLYGDSDRGGSRAITKIIKKTAQPIILIANEYYNIDKALRDACKPIEFRPVHKNSTVSVLKKICSKEGIKTDDYVISIIVDNAEGDLRSAINDLQAISFGRKKITKEDVSVAKRDMREPIFRVLSKIFKGQDIEEAMQGVYNLDETPEDFIRWLDENLPIMYKNKDALTGFEFLSKADVFLGRTRKRQEYTLWRYASALMVLGVLSAKSDEKGRGYKNARFQPPSTFRKLGQSKSKRIVRNSIATKIGRFCHTSQKDALNLISFFKILFLDEKSAINISALLRMDLNEISMLLEKRKDSKKVLGIFEAAREIIEKEESEFFENITAAKKEEDEVEEKNTFDKKVEKSQLTLFDF